MSEGETVILNEKSEMRWI